MIDIRARQKLREEQSARSMMNGVFSATSDAIKLKEENHQLMQEIINEKKTFSMVLDKVARGLVMIYNKIPAPLTLPRIFQVKGNVAIDSMPAVSVNNLAEVNKYLKVIALQLKQLATAISTVSKAEPKIEIPPIHIDGEGTIKQGLQEIKEVLQEHSKMLALQPKQKVQKAPDIKIPALDLTPIIDAIDRIPGGSSNADVVDKLADLERIMSALYDKPQMTPQPVTNVSINALGGSILTSQVQLGSTVTALPAIALANRRSLQLYNNGSNTVYVGGATVTVSNGVPLPSGAYSDVFNFGSNAVLYGVSQAGQNNDIRVLEVSDTNIGR